MASQPCGCTQPALGDCPVQLTLGAISGLGSPSSQLQGLELQRGGQASAVDAGGCEGGSVCHLGALEPRCLWRSAADCAFLGVQSVLSDPGLGHVQPLGESCPLLLFGFECSDLG